MTKSSAARIARRMPVKTGTVHHTGDYDGWEATVRLNPPLSVWEDVQSGDYERMKPALAAIVLAWNYVDEEGAPLPLPTDGGLQKCPPDLISQLIDGWTKATSETAEVPNG